MEHHFTQVSLIHEAVIRGALAALREPARLLTEIEAPRDVSDSTAPRMFPRAAAKRAADARDVPSAAFATASLLLSCGDGH